MFLHNQVTFSKTLHTVGRCTRQLGHLITYERSDPKRFHSLCLLQMCSKTAPISKRCILQSIQAKQHTGDSHSFCQERKRERWGWIRHSLSVQSHPEVAEWQVKLVHLRHLGLRSNNEYKKVHFLFDAILIILSEQKHWNMWHVSC